MKTDREIFIDFIVGELKYLTWSEREGFNKDELISKNFKRNGIDYVLMGRFNKSNYINAVLVKYGKAILTGENLSLIEFLSMAKEIIRA